MEIFRQKTHLHHFTVNLFKVLKACHCHTHTHTERVRCVCVLWGRCWAMDILWGVFLSDVFLLFIWCWCFQNASRSTLEKHFVALISAFSAAVCLLKFVFVRGCWNLGLQTPQNYLTFPSHTDTPCHSLPVWMNFYFFQTAGGWGWGLLSWTCAAIYHWRWRWWQTCHWISPCDHGNLQRGKQYMSWCYCIWVSWMIHLFKAWLTIVDESSSL